MRFSKSRTSSSPYALSRQPYFRPCRCGDFGFVTLHKPAEHRIPGVSALQTLRCHVSRLVAVGVFVSLKDVAASQYVCSRGADNPSSIFLMFLPSVVTSALRVTGGSVDVVECISVAQFRWRRFSIAQRVTPSLFVDNADRCTPEPQMEPESYGRR